MSGWQYITVTYDPTADGGEEQWRDRLEAEGWAPWLSSVGAWITVDGDRVRRWAPRRECTRPFSVHDHRVLCTGVDAMAEPVLPR
ncbi:MAG: hypothetical protein IE926_09830 [Micrococcales bacterium]|nr:hypothetical protein [Micrococcales bacterium]